jgi:hypothetical protein
MAKRKRASALPRLNRRRAARTAPQAHLGGEVDVRVERRAGLYRLVDGAAGGVIARDPAGAELDRGGFGRASAAHRAAQALLSLSRWAMRQAPEKPASEDATAACRVREVDPEAGRVVLDGMVERGMLELLEVGSTVVHVARDAEQYEAGPVQVLDPADVGLVDAPATFDRWPNKVRARRTSCFSRGLAITR